MQRRLAEAQGAGHQDVVERGDREVANRFEAVGVGRVKVVEHDDRAAAGAGDPLQQSNDAFEREQSQLRVTEIGRGRALGRPLGHHQSKAGVERGWFELDRSGAQPGAQRLRDHTERHGRGHG